MSENEPKPEVNGTPQEESDPVVAVIEVKMTAKQQLHMNISVPTRFLFNAMIETAKQNGLSHFAQMEALAAIKQAQGGIVGPPINPRLIVPRR